MSPRPWETDRAADLLSLMRRGGPRGARSNLDRHSTRSATQQSGHLSDAIESFHDVTSIVELLGGTQLRRVARTNGGEWAGPCPLCGGEDRLRTWPRPPSGHPRAWCRQCRASGDALEWAVRLSGRNPNQVGATSAFLRATGLLTPSADSATQQFAGGKRRRRRLGRSP